MIKKLTSAKLALAAIFACASLKAEPARSASDELRLPLQSKALTLDPLLAIDTDAELVTNQIFETLFSYNLKNNQTELTPLLAEKLPEYDSSTSVVTIRLKHDVLFQKNACFESNIKRELTAEDVIYSWSRLIAPGMANGFAGTLLKFLPDLKDVDYKTGRPLEKNKSIQIIDKYTLKLRINGYYLSFIDLLTKPHMAIVSRTCTRSAREPIGTGPFVPSKAPLSLLRNPDYRISANGKVSSITFVPVKDQTSAIKKLVAGDIDLVLVQQHDSKLVLENNGPKPSLSKIGIQIKPMPEPEVIYYALNMTEPAFKEKATRQWLAARLSPQSNQLMPSQLLYAPSVSKTLSQNGNMQTLKSLSLKTVESPISQQLLQDFAKQTKQAGIKPSIQTLDWPAFIRDLEHDTYQVVALSWTAASANPLDFLSIFYSKSTNYYPDRSNYKNEAYDTLFEKASKLPPGDELKTVVAKLGAILTDDMPWIGAGFRKSFLLHQKNLSGVSRNIWNYNYIANIQKN